MIFVVSLYAIYTAGKVGHSFARAKNNAALAQIKLLAPPKRDA